MEQGPGGGNVNLIISFVIYFMVQRYGSENFLYAYGSEILTSVIYGAAGGSLADCLWRELGHRFGVCS